MSYLISPNAVQRTSDYVNNQGRTTKRGHKKQVELMVQVI